MTIPNDLEVRLRESLERHLGDASSTAPANLAESIRYSLLAPGKRIRPRLSLACGRMLSLPHGAALPPALSIEMLHCFTLIHDDLPCMDDDDFRRGQPSNHRKFGEAIALLAGDALLALATDVFLEAGRFVPAERLLAGLKRLSASIGPRGVIGGQAAEELLGAESGAEELTRVHALKTGALFSASLLVPMDLAGISEDSSSGLALGLFARELGLAFQVADDLEDAGPDAPEGRAHPDVTNVLHFRARSEVRETTLARLRSASDTLASVWKHGADPLLSIAGEVMGRIDELAAGGEPA